MRLRRYSRALRRHIYPVDQPVTAQLPARPAALRLYTGGVAWTLGLDFDTKHHGAAAVAQHADDAARFFTSLGGRVVVDVAASGGRHLWVPLAVPITLAQAQQLAAGCRRLWPSLDISPSANASDGCLTAPGSRCKDGGYRTLITPLDDAVHAVTRRSAHDLVDRALHRLTALCGPLAAPTSAATVQAHTVAVNGGARPLSPTHTLIAEQGVYPPQRTTAAGAPWTRSEACYAVLAAAANRGYSEHDILHRLDTGHWPGLLRLYVGRYGRHWRRRLHAEWRKILQTASTHSPQDPQTTGGQGTGVAERDYARRWLAIMTEVVDQLVPGRARHNARALLWGLAWLAWRTARRHVQAGTRSYARACAGLLDHTTAAAILRHLRDLPVDQRPLRKISGGRGTHGDLYELVIPPAYAHLAVDPTTWPEPRPIAGIFGVRDPHQPRRLLLGATGWRVHQALTAGATGTAAQLARAAGVSRAEAYAVLPVLTRLGLARVEPGTASGSRWQAGEHTTEQAGGAVNAPAHLAQLDARHRREREQWRQVLAAYAERRARAIEHTPDPDEPLWWPPDWTTEPPEHPDDARPGAGAPGQHHGVHTGHAPAADRPGQHHHGVHDDEAAALALLTEVFGAQIIPTQPETPPTRRIRWLRHEAARNRANHKR